MNSYPLTSLQNSIWLLQQFNPNSSVFNIGGYALLKEDLVVPAFKSSFESILQQQVALRLNFIVHNEQIKQYIGELPDSSMDYIDFSTQFDSENACIGWIENDMKIPINLNNGQPFKSALLKQSEGCYYWYLKLHHIVGDGYSLSLLFNDLSNTYSDILNNTFYLKNNESINYIPFVQEEMDYIDSAKYKIDKSFWLKRNESFTIPFANDNNVDKINFIGKSNREEVFFKRNDFIKISECCKNNGVSVFHYFITVIYVFFKNTYMLEDFSLGLPVLNRTNFKAKRSVGNYHNVFPFRLTYDDNEKILTILKGIKDNFNACVRHMSFPINNMMENIEHINGKLYNITFSYQKIFYKMRFCKSEVEICYLSNKEQINDVEIHILDHNEKWDLKIIFDHKQDVFSIEEAKCILNKLNNLISTLFLNLEKEIFEINICDDKEQNLNSIGKFNF